MTNPAENLARNLQAVRQARGWSQQKLAAVAKVPRSTIASIEAGASNPTLAVLTSLAAALHWSLDELLGQPPAAVEIFSANERPKPRAARGGGEMTTLLPMRLPGVEFDQLRLKPGARYPGAPHREGTKEFLYCAKGEITLWVAGNSYRVAKGQTASFAGDQRHTYTNRGRGETIAYSVVFVPRR